MADEKESDINSRIPPELLSIIFQFLPFSDLKHALLVCKRWRDLGEQPSLWAKLELQFEGTKEVELHQVLAMKRLQSLQSLNLRCLDISDLIQFQPCLQTVLDCSPNLRKLALEAGSNFDPVPDNELPGIVETLVMFEEIVLADIDFKDGKQLLRAILTALPGEGSKLKMLTLIGPPMYEKELGAVLIEAREKGLTVKVPTSQFHPIPRWNLSLQRQTFQLQSFNTAQWRQMQMTFANNDKTRSLL